MRTVAEVHRVATIDMTFLAVRAAVGIVYAWCTVALLAARRRREPPSPPPVAGSDLSYEEYVAMRAAQRASSSAPATAPTPPIEATAPVPPIGATTPIPPTVNAGEMTSEAPNV
jgi:cytoskeletal protein RodZ